MSTQYEKMIEITTLHTCSILGADWGLKEDDLECIHGKEGREDLKHSPRAGRIPSVSDLQEKKYEFLNS
uniref:Uncharacterized protein n=1 Tax=Lepeophtheirus salmonis TaxID=72036 RepID=A0A0K2V0K1_LEPSM